MRARWLSVAAVAMGASLVVAPIASAKGKPSDEATGRYIVTFTQTTDPGIAVTKAKSKGVKVLREFKRAIKGMAAELTEAQVADLREDPGVLRVEPDTKRHVLSEQSPVTWGLDRIDQRGRPLDGRYTYSTTAANVYVYVIDTGILASHRQFGGRVLSGYDALGEGKAQQDCSGHGTHVAGTIGSASFGVAKAVKLIPVRTFGCDGLGYVSDGIQGIEWILDSPLRPAVINMSLGGEPNASEEAAVASAVAAGLTVVVAAGNESINACNVSPARVPSAITVAAVDATDTRDDYSNFGSCVDIFAPGSDITSTWPTSTTATRTISGTSMASPHVAGAAALYLAANPAATPAQVSNALIMGSVKDAVTSPGYRSPNRLLQVDLTGSARSATTLVGTGFAGSELNQLDGALGIAVDQSGATYVADSWNHRVMRFTRGASMGVVVAGDNDEGAGLNQLAHPSAVTVDSLNNVYVADSGNDRVVRWAPGASQGQVVAGGNGSGDALNQLSYPSGVAVDSFNNVYVADSDNDRVVRWAPGASQGQVVAGGNGRGELPNQLDNPQGLAITADGDLYVVDANNSRVMRWRSGASTGDIAAGGYGEGPDIIQLSSPSSVAVDPAGGVYVSDTANARVVRWAPNARSGLVVAGGLGWGPGPSQLVSPLGVALTSSGQLIVVSEYGSQLSLWPPMTAPRRPTAVSAEPSSATATAGSLTLRFTPAATGGTPILRFAATCTSSNGGVAGSSAALADVLNVSGLTTGKTYTCTVKASNGMGSSPVSASTPALIVGSPDAPRVTGVTKPASGRLTVSFTPAASNGSPITRFTATCSSSGGGVERSVTVINGAARQITVTGLTVGRSYRCQVRAINARGPGPYSAASRAIVA